MTIPTRPVPKSSHQVPAWQIILVFSMLAGAIILFWSMGAFRAPRAFHNIQYKAEGTGPAMITYLRPDGSRGVVDSTNLPWESSIFRFERGVDVIMTVAFTGDTGYIKCTIWMDGGVYITSTTNAPGDKAFCSGKAW